MYQPSYPSQPQQPYQPSSSDPYRAAPISVPKKQPYNAAFSPSPNNNAFSPKPSGQSQRYQLYSSQPQPQSSRPSSSTRYANHNPQYTNGNFQHPGIPQQQTPQQRYKGTLAPGTAVKVGEHSVRVERYLSEGGYAHVYLTTSERPIYPPMKEEKKGRWGEMGYTQHCLKRIAFEDEAVWVDVRKEIEVMKSLPPNPHLTQYLGSAHSRLPNGGYEVFILMEFCSGGGIIDLLNKRLRDRLKEIEILNIFTDVCEAVAAMHSLKQPLLHRDLKIENVLSGPSTSLPSPQRPTPLIFKLCDFGSTTFPATHPPQTKIEADALALDLNKHTTLQYRSPEMVEPMLGWPVGLPSDVWALGVLLYKLCYYTTPFEEHGTLAIVNAKYTFPQYPVYSPRIQHLIAAMLVDHPARRPAVFEVLKIAHEMSGTRPEVDYPTPSRLFAATSPQLPPRSSPQPSNLLDFTSTTSPINSTPVMQPSLASTVQPQRRGRPTREPSRNAVPKPAAIPPVPQPPTVPKTTSAPAKPIVPKLQVTGERKREPAKSQPAPSSGVDAFGMPAMAGKSAEGENGFIDSFELPKQGIKSTVSKLGGTLPRPLSGFGDSFSAQRPTLSPKKSVPAVSPSSNFPPSFGGQRTTSPVRKSPDPASSIPDGELSFEARFPSIETLSSGDVFSPIPAASPPPPNNLVSPVTSPPVPRPGLHLKPSVMGHLTGEHAPHHIFSGGAPQPRSTQVTGTAFKGIQGGMLSPLPVKTRTEYFENVILPTPSTESKVSPPATSSSAKSPTAKDLMTGEDAGELSVPLMRPTRTPSPGAAQPAFSSSLAGAKPVPTSGHNRPLLPLIDSVKPSSNINSDEWSPLERMRSQGRGQGQAGPVATRNQSLVDSSDEESGPEEASGTNRRPASPLRRGSAGKPPASPKIAQRMSAFEKPSTVDTSPLKRQTSPTKAGGMRNFPNKSATLQLPPDGRPADVRRGSGGRNRPQSMFIPSPSAVLSPREPGTAPIEQRSTHVRKGSITDIVSKYENLRPPGAPARRNSGEESTTSPADAVNAGVGSNAGVNGLTNGLGRKPSVATKPAGLRKATISTDNTASGQAEREAEKRRPGSPTKPSTSPTKTAASKTATESNRPPAVAAKPATHPNPVRHGDMPTVAGYSKSSSGRSFPITKTASSVGQSQPNSTTPIDAAVSDQSLADPHAGSGDFGARKGSASEQDAGQTTSGSASPEKQQPVNLLIARWNKGEVGSKPPPVKKGGYV